MMNHKKAWFLILILIVPLFLYVVASRADDLENSAESFRCDGNLVQMGDTKYIVKEKCGEPTTKQELGEIWVYDFGPDRFVYYVKFSNGAVFRIYTGGYGN